VGVVRVADQQRDRRRFASHPATTSPCCGPAAPTCRAWISWRSRLAKAWTQSVRAALLRGRFWWT